MPLPSELGYSIALEAGAGMNLWHGAVNQITDELGRSYSFELQDNFLVYYAEIHEGWETVYGQVGMPRVVASVTLPDGGVTQFDVTRDAVVRTLMTGEPFSQTVVSGPAGQVTYRFSQPFVEYSAAPSPDDVTNLQDPFRDTTMSFKRLEVTSGKSRPLPWGYRHRIRKAANGETRAGVYAECGCGGPRCRRCWILARCGGALGLLSGGAGAGPRAALA